MAKKGGTIEGVSVILSTEDPEELKMSKQPNSQTQQHSPLFWVKLAVLLVIIFSTVALLFSSAIKCCSNAVRLSINDSSISSSFQAALTIFYDMDSVREVPVLSPPKWRRTKKIVNTPSLRKAARCFDPKINVVKELRYSTSNPLYVLQRNRNVNKFPMENAYVVKRLR